MKKIAVISDIQINLSDKKNEERRKLLQKCLKNMNVDTLVVCGDITENARTEELECFFDLYEHNCQARNLFLIPGNMDETESMEGKKRFLDVYGKHTDRVYENTYFSYETDDCILIGISPEEDNDDEPLSERQISLLEESIKKAAKRAVPALVFCHYIINDTINIDWKYATLGMQSTQVKMILEKYGGKVICFSGHIHRGLIKEKGGSIITINNVTYISTPSICMPDRIHYNADNDDVGTGYLLEIYSDNIQIHGYNFFENKSLDDFDWRV